MFIENRNEKLALFTGIDEARFRRQVTPGDQIRFELEVLKIKATMAKLRGRATVDGEMACEATVLCALVDRKK